MLQTFPAYSSIKACVSFSSEAAYSAKSFGESDVASALFVFSNNAIASESDRYPFQRHLLPFPMCAQSRPLWRANHSSVMLEVGPVFWAKGFGSRRKVNAIGKLSVEFLNLPESFLLDLENSQVPFQEVLGCTGAKLWVSFCVRTQSPSRSQECPRGPTDGS